MFGASLSQSKANTLDFILDTASGDHPFDPYMSLLKVGGVMSLVGFPSEIKMHPGSLIYGTIFAINSNPLDSLDLVCSQFIRGVG